MRISDFSIRHPAIITILMTAAAVFGTLAMINLRKDMFSQVEFPTILIVTTYPGVGPEDIERDVTDILEKSLATLSGVKKISSTSGDSVSIITVEFDWETDVDLKLPEVRETVNAVMDALPEGIAGPPVMSKIRADMLPILTCTVVGEMDRVALTEFLDESVVPNLARIEGVSEVRIGGGRQERVEIRASLDSMAAKGVTVLDIYGILQRYNVSLPAGDVVFRGNELKMRTAGEFRYLEEIGSLVVKHSEGAYVRLEDVAEVRKLVPEPKALPMARSTGGGRELEPAIAIDILKVPEGDAVKIIDEAKRVLAEVESDYPGILEFKILADMSNDIDLALASVQSAALAGAGLAVLILFLFLRNFATTVIISVSIPFSVIMALTGMYARGQSLNLITMGGLTLSIGMMVDSAIVVLENTYSHFHDGMDRKMAASRGADEVGGAVLASTTTSLCVFVPILFMSGFAGAVLTDVAWTIIFALAGAAVVAVVTVPFLSSLFLRRTGPRRLPRGLSFLSFPADMFERSIELLTRGYRRALARALERKAFIFITAVALLVVSAFATDFLGFEFIPTTDMNEFLIEIETPGVFSVNDTAGRVAEIDRLLQQTVPEIAHVLYYVGQSSAGGSMVESNKAFARIRLVGHDGRSRRVHEIISDLQRRIPATIPDVDVVVRNGGLDSTLAAATGGAGFMIQVYGNNLQDVIAASQTVEGLIGQDPNVIKTEKSVSLDKQEMVSSLSLRYLGTLGVTPYEAAVTSRIVFNGMEVGEYRPDEKTYEIFLTSDAAGERIDEDTLGKINVRSLKGTLIPFSSFTDLDVMPTLSAVRHEDKMVSVSVTGYLRNPDVRGTSGRVTAALDQLDLPPGTYWRVGGSTAEMQKSFRSMAFAMAIAVFLVYSVMVIQFERFDQPLIVMASIPFTVIGVIGSLLVYGSTLNMIALLGLIALAGIVVNNAIVMIDFINLLRKRDDLSLEEAIVEGASSRLRPILMTTLTTVLGIIPMALGIGEGAEIYAPLGQTISGGLLTSTLITLFLIPVLYHVLETRPARGRSRGENESEGDETTYEEISIEGENA